MRFKEDAKNSSKPEEFIYPQLGWQVEQKICRYIQGLNKFGSVQGMLVRSRRTAFITPDTSADTERFVLQEMLPGQGSGEG